MENYNSSQVMFRLAIVAALRARKRADQAESEEAIRGQAMERRQRERDETQSTLTQVQAAAEGYINWVHQQAGTEKNVSWVERWERLPEAATARSRPSDFALPDSHKAYLLEIGAWRNALLHSDSKAKNRLTDLLITQKRLTPDQSPLVLMTADLAEDVLDRAETLFRWAEKHVGINAPKRNGAWIAPDEI
ncbi:hypothetical protein [Actinocorallia libanotica]|uniref:Uncharacterized protein n=1 Tax=Actinocorallia libanotica TaxID=46162 RepID=A0ABN1RVQ6_9ACTN